MKKQLLMLTILLIGIVLIIAIVPKPIHIEYKGNIIGGEKEAVTNEASVKIDGSIKTHHKFEFSKENIIKHSKISIFSGAISIGELAFDDCAFFIQEWDQIVKHDGMERSILGKITFVDEFDKIIIEIDKGIKINNRHYDNAVIECVIQ